MAEKSMVKNYLTAKAARQITETSDKMLNIAFKYIKEEAEYGKNEFSFDIYRLDSSVVIKIKNTLICAGYSVTELTDEEVAGKTVLVALLIKW
jgi:hypothetical protein